MSSCLLLLLATVPSMRINMYLYHRERKKRSAFRSLKAIQHIFPVVLVLVTAPPLKPSPTHFFGMTVTTMSSILID
jgi:hypothetical protein